jgi:hypothetical protein
MTDEQTSALLLKECEFAFGIITRYRELQGCVQRQFTLIWCSLMGVGYQMGNPNLHLVAGIASLVAWYSDARYVAKWRAMRKRYEAVASALAQEPDAAPIRDPLSLHTGYSAGDLRKAIVSRAHFALHGITLAVSVLVWTVQTFLRASPAK